MAPIIHLADLTRAATTAILGSALLALVAAAGASAAVGDTIFVSRQSDSLGGAGANRYSFAVTVSANGRYVTFASAATNLSDVDNPSPWFTDVFLRQVR
jgi:hypothetical protein